MKCIFTGSSHHVDASRASEEGASKKHLSYCNKVDIALEITYCRGILENPRVSCSGSQLVKPQS